MQITRTTVKSAAIGGGNVPGGNGPYNIKTTGPAYVMKAVKFTAQPVVDRATNAAWIHIIPVYTTHQNEKKPGQRIANISIMANSQIGKGNLTKAALELAQNLNQLAENWRITNSGVMPTDAQKAYVQAFFSERGIRGNT